VSADAWDAVDRWYAGLLVPPDDALDGALAAARDGGLPAIDVSPLQGKLLHILALVCGARAILELGTLGGYSTIGLARALPPGGRLVTLEASPEHAAVARTSIERAGLGGVVDLRVGPALETLPDVEGPFDLVFVDADKRSTPEYLEWALRLTRPGSLIVTDNVVRAGGAVEPDPADESAAGMHRFAEQLAAEPRLVSTVIQTVGSKGWDGLAISLVRR
jgi:predicted O-methyltransferase YrrM